MDSPSRDAGWSGKKDWASSGLQDQDPKHEGQWLTAVPPAPARAVHQHHRVCDHRGWTCHHHMATANQRPRRLRRNGKRGLRRNHRKRSQGDVRTLTAVSKSHWQCPQRGPRGVSSVTQEQATAEKKCTSCWRLGKTLASVFFLSSKEGLNRWHDCVSISPRKP